MTDHDDVMRQVKSLLAEERITEARSYLIQRCHENPEDVYLQTSAAIFMFNEQWLIPDTLEIIERSVCGNPKSADLWFMCAHACFALSTGDMEERRGIEAAIQAIKLNPQNLQPYQTLVNIYLLQQRFWEAYLVCRALAAEVGADNRVMKSLMEFSLRMADPNRTPYVGFVVDGEQLRYTVETLTSYSITASICHFNGKILDHEELRYARAFVGQADSILEVGTWSGNHTAYFLRFLVPSRYVGIEEHPAHAKISRDVAFLNKGAGVPCDAVVLHMCPGSRGGAIRVHGASVPRRPLDQIDQVANVA